MALRIGFDMDGTIADFESAFREVELRLFGDRQGLPAGEPDRENSEGGRPPQGPPNDAPNDAPDDADAKERIVGTRLARRRRDAVWAAIRSTPNFWETLRPLDDEAVRRIHTLMLAHHWEVFFITQRPKTDGDTVQRQTQRWLVRQGFDLPSVLVLGGSRGAAAGALRLDYHVDDSSRNCLDILSDSRARPLLVVPDGDDGTVASARALGIGTVRSIGMALDVLDEASAPGALPGVLSRIAALVGWRSGP